MNALRFFSTRNTVLALFFAALMFGGCDCARGRGLGSSYGVLAVVYTDGNGATVTSRDALYDFGTVFKGEQGLLKLVVTNQGTAPIQLSTLVKQEGDDVTVGTGDEPTLFAVEFDPDRSIDVSETVELKMAFNPKEQVDSTIDVEEHAVLLTLSVRGAAAGESTADVRLKGRAVFGACYLPRTLDFGPIARGHSGEQPVLLENNTEKDTTGWIRDIHSDTGDHTSFGIGADSEWGEIAIPARSSKSPRVVFAPRELRAYRAAVFVRRAAHCPDREMVLTGTGTDPKLAWNPQQVDFGYISIGAEATRQIIFTNLGPTDVSLTNIQILLPTDYRVLAAANRAPDRLVVAANGGAETLTVVCHPAALGGRPSQLQFDTNLPEQRRGLIPFKCFGGGPDIQVNPSPVLHFGKVPYFGAGAATQAFQTRKLTVMNVGTLVPDPSGNLRLGKVDLQGNLAPPYVEVQPLGSTQADEVTVTVPASYNPAIGVDPAVGKNAIDLVVRVTPKSVARKEAKVIIYSNDADEPAVEIQVTADATELPPCQLALSPTTVNFGVVSPKDYKDVAVKITNLGLNLGELCLLSDFAITPGSDPAFSIWSAPQGGKELQPQETTQVVVRVSPIAMPPAGTSAAITGTLTMNVSSPTQPQAQVGLRAQVADACLTIVPDNLDFGVVARGCSSGNRTFSMYNLCGTPVTVSQIVLSQAAGQPAGGVDCPGFNPCPEFFMTSLPPIPISGLVVNPGTTPITFSAKYNPIDLGNDTGLIEVVAQQAATAVTYSINLAGAGDLTGKNTDVFVQLPTTEADILFVIDDSCSMDKYQAALAQNFQAFIGYAQAAGIDYHIAVTTTDDPPSTWFDQALRGKFVGDTNNPKVLTPSTPGVEQLFQEKVNVGTRGWGMESCLQPGLKALTPPLILSENTGFLRKEANLAVICVTDARDQSAPDAPTYFNSYSQVKGLNHLDMFTFNAIAGFDTPESPTCVYDDNLADDGKYRELVSLSHGVRDEICTPDWAQALAQIGRTAAGFKSQFFLKGTPDLTFPNEIHVKVAGVEVLPVDGTGKTIWSYDPVANAIVFDPDSAPAPQQTLQVTYVSVCVPQ